MKKVILVLVLALTLASCKKGGPESPIPTPISPIETPGSTSASPLPTPAPAVRFSIDRPLRAGATMVTGTGLPGLPIRLYEVGMTGKRLADGVIGEQGTFSIQLLTPLKAGQRIGLVLGDLKGTSFTREQVKPYTLTDLPIIGLLFDDAPVE